MVSCPYYYKILADRKQLINRYYTAITLLQRTVSMNLFITSYNRCCYCKLKFAFLLSSSYSSSHSEKVLTKKLTKMSYTIYPESVPCIRRDFINMKAAVNIINQSLTPWAGHATEPSNIVTSPCVVGRRSRTIGGRGGFGFSIWRTDGRTDRFARRRNCDTERRLAR